MRQRDPRRLKVYAAVAALVAFGTIVLYEAFHIAHALHDLLLGIGDIFHKPITFTLAALLAAVIVGAIVAGMIWFHIEEIAKCWKRVSGSFESWLPSRRKVVRTISSAAIFSVAIFSAITLSFFVVVIPHLSIILQAASIETQPLYQPNKIPPIAGEQPTADSTPTQTVSPEPRMAHRHVCNLFEDATRAEEDDCLLFIKKHPQQRGTGDGSVPLPRPRPPLNLLPNKK